jgi:hypothetical protein
MFTRLSSAILYALLIVTSTIASTAAAAAAAATSIQWNSGGSVSLASHQNLIILT